MKCQNCGFEYDDSFKFCPNCSEPSTTIEETAAMQAPREKEPQENPPKKSLKDRVSPVATQVKEKVNKKTVVIGVIILALVAAAVVIPIVLTRPSYPDTISLGDFEEGDLEVKNLTLTKQRGKDYERK